MFVHGNEVCIAIDGLTRIQSNCIFKGAFSVESIASYNQRKQRSHADPLVDYNEMRLELTFFERPTAKLIAFCIANQRSRKNLHHNYATWSFFSGDAARQRFEFGHLLLRGFFHPCFGSGGKGFLQSLLTQRFVL